MKEGEAGEKEIFGLEEELDGLLAFCDKTNDP